MADGLGVGGVLSGEVLGLGTVATPFNAAVEAEEHNTFV